MHYVTHCLDHPGAVQKRLAHYGAHKTYLAFLSMKSVISGPPLADDEEPMLGNCFAVEKGGLAEVEALNRNDPFAKPDPWRTVSTRPFNKRVGNRT